MVGSPANPRGELPLRRGYYRGAARQLLRHRYHLSQAAAAAYVPEHTTVFSLYPGFIDPESVVANLTRELDSADLMGKPYTAVIVDGIHNLMLQYPLLEREPLIWPTLSRVVPPRPAAARPYTN